MSLILSDEQIEQYLSEITTGLKSVIIDISDFLSEKAPTENIQKKYKFILRHPSLIERRIANMRYNDAYAKAQEEGFRSLSELEKDFIEKYNLYTENDKKREDYLRAEIDVQNALFKAAKQPSYKEKYRESLEAAKSKYFNWVFKKLKYNDHTRESISDKARILYLVSVCTLDYATLDQYWENEDQFYNNNDAIFNSLVLKRLQIELKDFLVGYETRVLRAIARSNQWKSIWSISLKTGAPLFGVPLTGGKNIFDGPVSSWTHAQIQLCNWSMLYDSVMRGMEPPPNSIYENDELFDKYVSKLVEKQERERIKNLGASGGSAYDHGDVVVIDPQEKELLFDDKGNLRK
jgi:hypothetical protein